MIRKANSSDMAAVMLLLKDVVSDLIEQGIDQWDSIYPDAPTISNDINERSLFIYEHEAKIKGMLVLNEYQDSEYSSLKWKYVDGKVLVVHRLCVDPKFRGLGIAKKLMQFAEDFAYQNGYTSIRLDTFTKNPVTVAFYRELKYEVVGTVTFRKGGFFCYEKPINIK